MWLITSFGSILFTLGTFAIVKWTEHAIADKSKVQRRVIVQSCGQHLFATAILVAVNVVGLRMGGFVDRKGAKLGCGMNSDARRADNKLLNAEKYNSIADHVTYYSPRVRKGSVLVSI